MMRLSVPAPTRCSCIKHRGSMHKFMGLHHHNLLATAPNQSSGPGASGAQISRSSSGPLMPRSSSYGMLTYAVRGGMGPNSLVTVRCMPVEDDGLLQLSGTDPGDAIMGDVDTEPRPGMMGQEQLGQEGRTQAALLAGNASIAHALKASIPKGPLAENAAMCEPLPGDPPGDISDQELAAMREGRQGANANISTASTTPASSVPGSNTAANEGEGVQTAGGSAALQVGGVEAGRAGSNAPGNDPGHIKQVVQEETLRDQE